MKSDLHQALHFLRHYMLSQGPLAYFIHHNTVHAFENEDFFTALRYASNLYKVRTLMPMSWYIEQLHSGRITEADLDDAIDVVFKPSKKNIAKLNLKDLIYNLLFYSEQAKQSPKDKEVVTLVKSWSWKKASVPNDYIRYRRFWCYLPERKEALVDRVKTRSHQYLLEFLSSYYDRGHAYWPMSNRHKGILACFKFFVDDDLPFSWKKHLKQITRSINIDATSEHIVIELLNKLGIHPEQFKPFLFELLSSVKGWAALSLSYDEHPEYNTSHTQNSFEELITIVLIVELATYNYLHEYVNFEAYEAQEVKKRFEDSSFDLTLSLLTYLKSYWKKDFRKTYITQHDTLAESFAKINLNTIKEIWHRAYETHLEKQFLSVISLHPTKKKDASVAMQFLCCLDDREESLRRHLESIAPDVETFGVAGHFNLKIMYRGAGHVHYRPQCPPSASPEFFVWETENNTKLQKIVMRQWGRLRYFMFHRMKNVAIAYPLLFILSPFLILNFAISILSPYLALKMKNIINQIFFSKLFTEINYEQTKGRTQRGYTVTEMSEVVESILRGAGLIKNFSKLIVICGHGSTSLNNPQEAAHDCGACGGGNGTVNARLFSTMANRNDVRTLLNKNGIIIPESTYFVPAMHNTANDLITMFDTDKLDKLVLEKWQNIFNEASSLDALERVRKFKNVPLSVSRLKAFKHVQGRANNYAQPRPEYGHSTNALCIIGHRNLTQNSFFDRRAFLTSYNRKQDKDGKIISSLLSAVLPVCAGINLEYYFSYVDNAKLGSGVKQPHNVTGVVGVMNGYMSDLLMGLPWQMVETHEPVRLMVLVDAKRSHILKTIASDERLKNLCDNEWLLLNVIDGDRKIYQYQQGQFILRRKIDKSINVTGLSQDYFHKRRDLLPFVTFEGKQNA